MHGDDPGVGLYLVEFHKISISLFLQPTEFPLNGSMTLCCIKVMAALFSLLCVVSKLAALSSRWLMKMLIRIGSPIDPWVLMLVYALQLDFLPLIITNCSGSFQSDSLSAHPAHTSPASDIIPLDKWRTPSLYSKLFFPRLWHHCLGVFWICIQHKEWIVPGSKQVKRGERRQGALQLHMLLMKNTPHCSLCTWMFYLPPAHCLKSRQFEGAEKIKKDSVPWFHPCSIRYRCSQHLNSY